MDGLKEVAGKHLLLRKELFVVFVYLLVNLIWDELIDAVEGKAYNMLSAVHGKEALTDLVRQGRESDFGIDASRYCGTIAD